MNLKLNSPPSFYNPKSVIVIALPPIEPQHTPHLHLEDPDEVLCLANPSMALPFRGTPTLFSTGFSHDLALVFGSERSAVRIALTPDAYDGGLIPANPISAGLLDRFETKGADGSTTVQGRLEDYWGFEKLNGPSMTFQYSPGDEWKLVRTKAVMAGEDGETTLKARGSACVHKITVIDSNGESTPLIFDRDSRNGNLVLQLRSRVSQRVLTHWLSLSMAQPRSPESVSLCTAGTSGWGKC
jgi:hypothetical protein